MKLRKAFTGLLLGLTLAASIGTAAMADPITSVSISKTYNLEGAGTSPVETFQLLQTGKQETENGVAFANIPDLATATGDQIIVATVDAATGAAAAGAAASAVIGNFSITLPLPTAYPTTGRYVYTLQEATTTNAGVTYDTNSYYLVVDVINGTSGLEIGAANIHKGSVTGAKSESVTNTYSAGTLSVKKEVTGNMGDKTTYFPIKVTLTGETGKTYASSYAVSGGSATRNPNTVIVTAGEETEYTFYLKHDETIKIENLPYNVTYTVTEAKPDGYENPVITRNDGTVDSAAEDVTVTNEKKVTLDTGINMDTLPYILMVAVVAAALIVLVSRRRFAGRD